MAVKVVVHRLCDRCQRPFHEETRKYGEELPVFERKTLSAKLVVTGTDGVESSTPLFTFNDLCEDCDRVVNGYIKKIRLEETNDKKDKKLTKAEPDIPAPPAVPDPPDKSKDPPQEPPKAASSNAPLF